MDASELLKIFADESIIENTGKKDIDLNKFNHYFQKVYKKDFDEIDHSLDTLLEKLHLARKGKLNLAGLLLFGRHPSFFRPAFIINIFGARQVVYLVKRFKRAHTPMRPRHEFLRYLITAFLCPPGQPAAAIPYTPKSPHPPGNSQ